MKRSNTVWSLVYALTVIGTAACSSTQTPPPANGGDVAQAAAPAKAQPVAATPSAAPAPMCAPRAGYFALDSSVIDPGARGQLADDASCISRALNAGKIEISGMTDARGTEEYN